MDIPNLIRLEPRTITTKNGNTYRKKVAILKCPGCEKIYEKIHYHDRTPLCKSCSAKRVNKQRTGMRGYKDIGELNGSYFRMLKYNATKRKLNFEITQQEAWELFMKQQGKCAISGLNISLKCFYSKNSSGNGTHLDRGSFNASLDRIDSSKDYTSDNIQWVHKVINIMKGNLTDNDFIYFCKEISQNNLNKDNTEPTLLNGGTYFKSKVQRLMSEDTSSNNLDTSTPQPDVLVEDIV